MKFNREQFASALTAACRVIERKPVHPICQDVLVREAEGGAEIIGTDLRATSCTVVECDGVGDFCAPAHDLLAVASSLDSDDVTVLVKDTCIEVSGGGAKFELPLDKPRDFPAVPSFDGKWAETDAAALASLLTDTEYAALGHDARVHLTAVILAPIKDGVEAVATDGHRMAINRAKIAWPHKEACLVPASLAVPISKMLDVAKTCDVRVVVSSSAKMIQVRAGKSAISGKLVNALPIPYANFIADRCWASDPVLVNKQELSQSIKRALSFKGEITKKDGTTDLDVAGDIAVSGEEIAITRRTNQKRFEEKISASVGAREDKKTRANLRYMLDGIERLSSENIEIHIRSDLDHIIMRNGDGDKIAIVMPVHP